MRFLWIQTRAGNHISALFPFGKATLNEIARKSTGFRGVRRACIWNMYLRGLLAKGVYGKVDAMLDK
jgi:hypothetical protein